ncbi:MAG: hypothetical protein E5Y63_24460 [Mesorhizobium sp.]|nr:MAG: hypothetical protein EOR04_29140 [Mesorhizobium sp.]TIM27423.1 MAG: hypothetical protein E5Y63_24460 [Mesorhizobium sp.]
MAFAKAIDFRSAPPLIRLRAPSPRKRGEARWPQPRRSSATPAIGKTGDDSVLLPVTIRGEVPGRAMRGGADFDDWSFSTRVGALSFV